MNSPAADQRSGLLSAAGLVAPLAAGMALASSWFVTFPAVVLLAAWLIAFAAMATVIDYALRESRAAGIGFLASIGRSFKALGRFIFWFF